MRLVIAAFWHALVTQLHIRLLWLTVLPFLLSVVIWGLALWFGLQPLIDWLYRVFVENNGFDMAGHVLGWFNSGALRAVVVPLLAMWAFLPFMILTTLVFVGMLAMPAITRHLSRRHFADLEKKQGGTLFGSIWTQLWCFTLFAILWLVTLPVSLIPPMAFLVQPVLWGWLTYRVMAYDVLAEHATEEESNKLLREHRWRLLAIGTAAGLLGAAPTALWVGGVLSVIFLPFFAAVSVWLYVLVFIFTALWFQYYCLEALRRMRTEALAVI